MGNSEQEKDSIQPGHQGLLLLNGLSFAMNSLLRTRKLYLTDYALIILHSPQQTRMSLTYARIVQRQSTDEIHKIKVECSKKTSDLDVVKELSPYIKNHEDGRR